MTLLEIIAAIDAALAERYEAIYRLTLARELLK